MTTRRHHTALRLDHETIDAADRTVELLSQSPAYCGETTRSDVLRHWIALGRQADEAMRTNAERCVQENAAL